MAQDHKGDGNQVDLDYVAPVEAHSTPVAVAGQERAQGEGIEPVIVALHGRARVRRGKHKLGDRIGVLVSSARR